MLRFYTVFSIDIMPLSGLPDFKAGQYLECGEGEEYSRVLVLSDTKLLVKEGAGRGHVLTPEEWYVMIGEAKGTIRNTSYFNDCEGCPYYADDAINCPVRNIESIGKKMVLRTQSDDSIGRKGILRQPSIHSSSTKTASINDNVDVIPIEKRTAAPPPPPPPPRTKLPWYYNMCLCGLFDD
jgi:hypothetical protein